MEIFIDKKREEDQRQTNKQTNEQTKKRNKRKIEKKKGKIRFTFQIVESIVKFHRGC